MKLKRLQIILFVVMLFDVIFFGTALYYSQNEVQELKQENRVLADRLNLSNGILTQINATREAEETR